MIDIKLLLARILNRLNPTNAFVVESHQLYTSASPLAIPANSATAEIVKTFTKQGYYPLAISGWDMNGTKASYSVFAALCITKQEVGEVEVKFSIRNLSTGQASLYPDIYVLWLKVI